MGPGHPFKIHFRAERWPPGRCRAATPGRSPQQQQLQEQRLLQQQLPQPRSQGAGWRRLRRLSPRHDGSSAGRGRRDFTQPARPSFHRKKSLKQFRAIFNAHGPAGWTLRLRRRGRAGVRTRRVSARSVVQRIRPGPADPWGGGGSGPLGGGPGSLTRGVARRGGGGRRGGRGRTRDGGGRRPWCSRAASPCCVYVCAMYAYTSCYIL